MKEMNSFLDVIAMELRKVYPDLRIGKTDVEKLQNQSYEGIFIACDDSCISSTINMIPFYNSFKAGESFDSVLTEVKNMIEDSLKSIPKIDKNLFTNYSEVKDHLFVQLVGADMNKEQLSNVPHTKVLDMAIVYRIDFGNGTTALITNQVMNSYGISKETLHQDALKSSSKNHPMRIRNMDEVIYEISDGLFGSKENFTSPMWVVSNEEMVNGASVILYPEFLNEVRKNFTTGFYILPSSIHECLLIPDDFGACANELKQMVCEVNSEQVLDKDKLTDNVYHCTACGMLQTAEEYEN